MTADIGHDGGTRARILDVVEALMMERGFNAISYQDVADAIGIRKASIHYHFATKGDLGVAVIGRYVDKLVGAAAPIEGLTGAGFVRALDHFLAIFEAVAASPQRVCLGGVLGAEYATLPGSMQAEVRRFYRLAQGWLGELLETGRRAAVFRFEGAGEAIAAAIMAMMEGALIIARALGEPRQLAMALDQCRRLAGV